MKMTKVWARSSRANLTLSAHPRCCCKANLASPGPPNHVLSVRPPKTLVQGQIAAIRPSTTLFEGQLDAISSPWNPVTGLSHYPSHVAPSSLTSHHVASGSRDVDATVVNTVINIDPSTWIFYCGLAPIFDPNFLRRRRVRPGARELDP